MGKVVEELVDDPGGVQLTLVDVDFLMCSIFSDIKTLHKKMHELHKN